MERDDRLFAVIGSAVALGAAGIVCLVGSTPLGPPDVEVRTGVPLVPATRPSSEVVSSRPVEPAAVPAVHRPDPVDGRDGLVRAATRRMTRHPEVLRWLVTDDLANRIVETVNAVADGRIPRDHAGVVVAADRPFLVYETSGGFAVAAGTSRRFDLVVEALTSVDPRDAAALLEEIAPDLEAAWTDR